ncbi:SDR family oxidoreductase [Arthrobacter sp. TMN-50]
MNADLLRPLEGQHAVVTGARTGIGLACAERLAKAGANVTLWGHRGMDEAAQSVARHGGPVDVIVSDLGDPLDARAQAERLGAVDILVNNAGIIHREPAAAHAPDAWTRVLSLNLDTIWHLSQVFGAGMIDRGHGRVISIASLLSFQGGINVPSYAASKHAVVGLTKALANEWAAKGVTVNAVAPGYIATNNTEALRNDVDRERSIRERIPAGRWGSPEDIAGAVAFLAGPEAGYVNGHTLVVDGGWMGR